MAGLVQLKAFADLAEAQVARSMLEARDIPAFLFDEHLGGNLFPAVALFGVRLMVPEDRLDEARRFLETVPEPPEWPGDDENRA